MPAPYALMIRGGPSEPRDPEEAGRQLGEGGEGEGGREGGEGNGSDRERDRGGRNGEGR